MSKIPKLAELLQEPTVFILGAGASKPYGFPTWEELKKMFLDECKISRKNDRFSSLTIDYWQKFVEGNSTDSVDLHAHRGDDQQREFFQHVIASRFYQIEKTDSQSDHADWIEVFCTKLETTCVAGDREKILKNLSFINFNYDRSFFHRYYKGFIEPLRSTIRDWDWPSQWTKYGEDFCTILHPHGSLGQITSNLVVGRISDHTKLNPGYSNGQPYGGKKINSHDFKHLFLPVEQCKPLQAFNSLGAYYLAQTKFSMCKNVVVIGMSQLGWEHCYLEDQTDCSLFTTGYEALQAEFVVTELLAKELMKEM